MDQDAGPQAPNNLPPYTRDQLKAQLDAQRAARLAQARRATPHPSLLGKLTSGLYRAVARLVAGKQPSGSDDPKGGLPWGQ